VSYLRDTERILEHRVYAATRPGRLLSRWESYLPLVLTRTVHFYIR
jgi:hypothetical protein